MAIDSPIGVEVFFWCVFPKPWQLGVCFWCVCAFFGHFWSIGVCVECVVFCLSKSNNYGI